MFKIKILLSFLLLYLLGMLSFPTLALSETLNSDTLYKVKTNEDDILLLDVVLNNRTIARSIDAYLVDDRLLLSVEPLFDALKIRYVINKNKFSVWNGDTVHEFDLNDSLSSVQKNQLRWASDDFYFFIDFALFEALFPTKMEYLAKRLQLRISTPEKFSIFPYQKINKQNEQRRLERVVGYNSNIKKQIPITIADEYQLLTIPHGRVNFAVEQNSNKLGALSSVQLTSDFLYHSAELTFSDNYVSEGNNTDINARLTLSRYKTKPDDYILGVYDRYQIGDVTGRSNSLTTSVSSGIGFTFDRNPEGYRAGNQLITLEETAPPGWEVELFHNQIFIEALTVPANGLLIFENVDVTYGQNTYLIKLYGPYGEEEVITKKIDLTQNALAKGEFAHYLYGLDDNHRLINDNNNDSYNVNNLGATFDYGISDVWQVGFGFSSIGSSPLEDDKQFYNFKNAITLPGLLLENDISLDQNGNYAQLTTLVGSIFEQDKFSLSYESSDDFSSDRIVAAGKSDYLKASYFKPLGQTYLNFDVGYRSDDSRKELITSARIAGNLNLLRFSNTFNYIERTESTTPYDKKSLFTGSFGLSGTLPFDIQVRGKIDYEPNGEDFILESSDIRLLKRVSDPWETIHYLTVDYRPLQNGFGAKWRVGHRVAWQEDSFQLNLSSYYDQNKNWSIQLGLQFFISYDHRNNNILFSDRIHTNTASLDVHTYLDRHLNGVYDPLDYNLSGVTFRGNPEWNTFSSGKNGRIILPGVYAATPFPFSAKWKEGSSTINNDYVVYTHPGAYIDVNMPFILSTDFAGFVLRSKNGNEVGLQNVLVELFDAKGELISSQESDLDGYYEFLSLIPGNYIIRIAQSTLLDKRYTSNLIGFNVASSGNGGYVELPSLKVRRLNDDNERDDENIDVYLLTAENTDAVVWDDDKNIRQNYFTLPTKDKIKAKYSLSQPNTLKKENEDISKNNRTADKKVSTVLSLNNSDVRMKDKTSLLPQLRINNPSIPVTASKSKQMANTNINPSPILLDDTFSAMVGNYTIQLGMFTIKRHAEALLWELITDNLVESNFQITPDQSTNSYKLTYGRFVSKNSGINFAKNNLAKQYDYYVRELNNNEVSEAINKVTSKNTDLGNVKSGWVIQFYAGKSKVIQRSIIEKNSVIGALFSAQKWAANNDYLNCLISHNFTTKNAANKALKSFGLKGWVVNVTNYENIKAIK